MSDCEPDLSVDMAAVRQLLDREAIREVIHRYCRAIDRCDGELLRSCYHSDAIEDHGGFFRGPREEWVKFTVENLRDSYQATTHMAMNITIELAGEEAYSETYVLATHECLEEGTGAQLKWLGGRYIDRFVRRDGVWRILRRTLVVDWTHREPLQIAFGKGAPVGDFTAQMALRRGLHSREDPAYLETAVALLG